MPHSHPHPCPVTPPPHATLPSRICHPEVRKPPLWGWAGSWGSHRARGGGKAHHRHPPGRFPRGPDTPLPQGNTTQAVGFACFNDGLGEMWIESPEIQGFRRPPAPHAHADVRAAGDTNRRLADHQLGSAVCTPPSSQHRVFLRVAIADTGNKT